MYKALTFGLNCIYQYDGEKQCSRKTAICSGKLRIKTLAKLLWSVFIEYVDEDVASIAVQ